jgi:hypothetical protein
VPERLIDDGTRRLQARPGGIGQPHGAATERHFGHLFGSETVAIDLQS